MNILVVIPARGGSKGIPRKNLRQLNGRPLIYYAIKTALSSKYNPDVYVSSEDDEILYIAEQLGAQAHKRDLSISDDKTTLDPVVYACYQYAKKQENTSYDLIITIQPTSPLLKTSTLDHAIEDIVKKQNIDTVIAAKDNTHLSWRKDKGRYLPNYTERVNRQYLTPTYTETGAFLITRSSIITPESRIGQNVDLYILDNAEGIDIDIYEDWNLCEYHLKNKHILFVVTGNDIVGLGHVYNTLIIANDILNHQVTFLADRKSRLAYKKIASRNYPVFMQEHDDILEDIEKISPDIVINDRLDTSMEYVCGLKALGIKTINFEDLGEGAKHADLVINAIYPERQMLPNHYFGHEYFILRDEFIYSSPRKFKDDVKNVLITFGGVDPNNYTKKVLESVYDYCCKHNIEITIIAGFGYRNYDSFAQFNNIHIKKNVTNISKYMSKSDLIFTSAGRTTYEVASIGTPAIILAQNEREMTHFFASSEYGFLNLSLGYNLSNDELRQKFIALVESKESRSYMCELMKKCDLKSGRKRVNRLIQNFLEEL
ncbi:MAG: acylneuraminate cytidylyltransferase [Candidatus Marinimicrobia bacterium]|nr:acylneuraminate cytidylyltransferase [Candidatus Neomarinimicrobiota bacterium]